MHRYHQTKLSAWPGRYPSHGQDPLGLRTRLKITLQQTEHKANPQWVSNDMRTAREEQNNRQFDRQEWLSKSQVQGFFPHLAASRRRQQCSTEIELNTRELLLEEEEADRQHLIDEVTKEPKP